MHFLVGISHTTVSLILNNKATRIPESTKELVLRTAKELNYRPNQLAISLLKKKTKTLGLLIPDINNAFFSNLAKGVENEAHKYGWTLILCNTDNHYERDLEYINLLSSKGVEGILYCMASDTNLKKFVNVKSLFESLNIPFVMIDRTFDISSINSTKIDHRFGGYIATEHLISLGHTKIACITGPLHLEDSNNRLLGYKDALNKHGIPFDDSLIYSGNYQMSSGMQGVQNLRNKDYTAIFAFNDLMAFGVYKMLKQLGKRIPNDISVIGYDDISFSEMLDVPLTTINQPINRAGKLAVRHLIDSIESKTTFVKIPVFSPKLVIRESTAPPKSTK